MNIMHIEATPPLWIIISLQSIMPTWQHGGRDMPLNVAMKCIILKNIQILSRYFFINVESKELATRKPYGDNLRITDSTHVKGIKIGYIRTYNILH